MMLNRMKKRNYYTLKEVLTFLEEWDVKYETGFRATNDRLLVSFLNACGYDSEYLTTDQKSEVADKLWVENIVGKFRDCFIVYKDDDELKLDDIKQFAMEFLHVFNDSSFKYKYMIELYEDNLANLMDGIKVTSENRFNDTPQNVQGAFDWSTDDHLTNVTKNETVADVTTKMGRIKEIQDNLRDLYSDWTEEFKVLFIYE